MRFSIKNLYFRNIICCLPKFSLTMFCSLFNFPSNSYFASQIFYFPPSQNHIPPPKLIPSPDTPDPVAPPSSTQSDTLFTISRFGFGFQRFTSTSPYQVTQNTILVWVLYRFWFLLSIFSFGFWFQTRFHNTISVLVSGFKLDFWF